MFTYAICDNRVYIYIYSTDIALNRITHGTSGKQIIINEYMNVVKYIFSLKR